MKNALLLALALAATALPAPANAFDGPYFKKIYDKDGVNVNASLGAVFDETGAQRNGAFTNVALVYHDADANNTIIPESLQAYIPPESWSLLNLGYGGGLAGIGASINLVATAQGYLSRAFLSFANPGLNAFGTLIKPSASGLSINAGPEWFSTVVKNSIILPFDQWKGVPGWFVGGSYVHRFN